MKVGFLGLGGMGRGMAGNLVEAGHEVTVWNRSKDPVKELVGKGAREAREPVDAAGGEVVISMLADDAATESVLVQGGVLDALQKGGLHLSMATISLALARRLAGLHEERGQHYVGAPVLGRVDVAAAGQLNIMVAGDAAQIERAQPLLDAMGQRTWRFGDRPEQAHATKLCANFLLISAIEAMAEAGAVARGHGVDVPDFIEMISSTLFACPVYKGYGGMIAKRKYEPAGMKMRLGLKDVRLAQDAAFEANVPLPFAGIARDAFLDGLAHGQGEIDLGGLAEVARRRAGQED